MSQPYADKSLGRKIADKLVEESLKKLMTIIGAANGLTSSVTSFMTKYYSKQAEVMLDLFIAARDAEPYHEMSQKFGYAFDEYKRQIKAVVREVGVPASLRQEIFAMRAAPYLGSQALMAARQDLNTLTTRVRSILVILDSMLEFNDELRQKGQAILQDINSYLERHRSANVMDEIFGKQAVVVRKTSFCNTGMELDSLGRQLLGLRNQWADVLGVPTTSMRSGFHSLSWCE